jgi:serine/threonine protein kinase
MPTFEKLQLHFPSKQKLRRIDVSDIRVKGYPKIAHKVPLKYRQNMAICVLEDISQAISYISGTGIVHADISPGNIMEKPGSILRRKYVLVDWGASSLIHRYPEDSFGSLHFTAPERLNGEVGVKSDLFSLGVTCYYILLGKIPFPGSTGELYHLSVLERDGISPSEAGISILPALDKLIRDLIRHNPKDRPNPADVCKRVARIRSALESA